jgi:hypothetical protein
LSRFTSPVGGGAGGVTSVNTRTGAVTGVADLTASQTFTGAQLFTPATNITVALTARQRAGNFGNLQQWQNSAGQVLGSVGYYGNATFSRVSATETAEIGLSNSGLVDEASLTVVSQDSYDHMGMSVQWRDSSNITLGYINNSGNLATAGIVYGHDFGFFTGTPNYDGNLDNAVSLGDALKQNLNTDRYRQDVPARATVSSSSTMTSGTTYYSFFTLPGKGYISYLRFGVTSAASGISSTRAALYRIGDPSAPNTVMTLVQQSAVSTTNFNTANTYANFPITSTTLEPGVRYAIAVYGSWSTPPSVLCGPTYHPLIASETPYIAGSVVGTSFANTTTNTLTKTTQQFYVNMGG